MPKKSEMSIEIGIIRSKIAIINKHLNKRPITKTHEEFLMKRLLISVTDLSEIEQTIIEEEEIHSLLKNIVNG